jgi:hypothetical protein
LITRLQLQSELLLNRGDERRTSIGVSDVLW